MSIVNPVPVKMLSSLSFLLAYASLGFASVTILDPSDYADLAADAADNAIKVSESALYEKESDTT